MHSIVNYNGGKTMIQTSKLKALKKKWRCRMLSRSTFSIRGWRFLKLKPEAFTFSTIQGGAGKTFVFTLILASIRPRSQKALALASSGIADSSKENVHNEKKNENTKLSLWWEITKSKDKGISKFPCFRPVFKTFNKKRFLLGLLKYIISSNWDIGIFVIIKGKHL